MSPGMNDESSASAVAVEAVAVPPEWFLTVVCALDEAEPGFAARVLRASKGRRQLIAACLAAALERPSRGDQPAYKPSEEDELRVFLDRVGDPSRLLSTRPAKLLEQAFGDCPKGFAPAVKKTGPDIERPDHYLCLHDIFSSPERKQEARLLSRASTLNAAKTRLVRNLPSELLHPALLDQLNWKELRMLRDVMPALHMLFPDARPKAWRESFQSLARRGRLSSFVKSWLKRAELPEPPIKGDDKVWPLRTVRMMLQAAQEFRNCLRGEVIEALKGEAYFYESRLLDTPIIAQLSRDLSTGGWKLEGLYAKSNGEVSDAVNDAVTGWLKEHGIGFNEVRDRSWGALERLWHE